MTRLISQYEASFHVTEPEEADRLYYTYGWVRSCQLVQVIEATCPRPYRAFWFRVACLLAEKPDGSGLLPKEREVSAQPVVGRLSINVAGIKVTRAEFLRWLQSKGSVLRS